MSKTKQNTGVKPFSIKDRLGYLMGDFGCNMSFSLISGYMMLFYTQYIGVSLVHYGFIILFTKIWDAVNDPLIGALADKFTPKSGSKFKPWIFWGSFPLAFGSSLLFLNTQSWPYFAKIIVCVIGYLVWDIAYTVVNVPYGSMNATITSDPVERSQLSTWRSFGAMVAALPISIIIPQLVYKKELIDGVEKSVLQGHNLFFIAIGMGLIALISFQLVCRLCTERITVEDRKDAPKFSYVQALKGFFTNRAMLALAGATLAQVIFMMGAQSTGGLVYQMYFGDGSLSSFAVLGMLGPMVVCAPLVKPLVKKFGKKALCTWPLLISIAAYGIILMMPKISPAVYIGLTLVAGLGIGFYSMVSWSLVSDCIDYIEYETGRREEGTIYATYSMVRKLGQGIGQSLIPFIIALAIPGLEMNNAATWNSAYGLTMKNLAVGLPLVGVIIMFIFFKFVYNLDNKKLEEVEKALGRQNKGPKVTISSAVSASTNLED